MAWIEVWPAFIHCTVLPSASDKSSKCLNLPQFDGGGGDEKPNVFQTF